MHCSAAIGAGDNDCGDVLQMWIVQQGLAAIQLLDGTDAAKPLSALVPLRTQKLIPPLPSPDVLFTPDSLRGACRAVEAMLCPPVGIMALPARLLTAVFPSKNRKWKQVNLLVSRGDCLPRVSALL